MAGRWITALSSTLGRPAVFGMVHVAALPGSPLSRLSMDQVVERSVCEAETLLNCNVDGVVVENMWDLPYQRAHECTPVTVACLTRVCCAVRQLSLDARIGVQVLSGQNREALAIALATGLDFVRVEGFAFAHIGDEGLTESSAADVLRYRRCIGAEGVAVIADIKKKHSSHALTSDISLVETLEAARFMLADGVIITGKATGDAPSEEDLQQCRAAAGRDYPILMGSGITRKNVAAFRQADAWIIGSHFKKEGDWRNEICADRVRSFMESADKISRP